LSVWGSGEGGRARRGESAGGTSRRLGGGGRAAPEPAAPKPEQLEDDDWQPPYRKVVRGGFLVAAYRRPEFRVDANLASDSSLAGAPLKGVVTARYLFGAPMPKRPVVWTFSRTPVYSAPAADLLKYPASRFPVVGC